MPSGFTGFTEFLYLTAAGGEYKRWLARIQSFCRTMSSFENPKNPKESQRIFARGAPGRRESKDSFEILGRRLSRPSSRSTRPAPAMQRIPENPRASHDDRDSRPIPEPDAPFVHTGRTSRAKNPKESQRIAPDSRCFRRCFEDALEILGRFQSQTPRLFTQAAPAEQRIPKNPRESHQTRDASGDTSQMLWRCSGGSRAHTHTPDESLRESQRIRRRAELQTTQGIPEHRRASRRNGVHVTHTHTSEMVLFFCLCQTKLKFISTSNAHVATPVPARRLRHPAVVHPNDARAERTRRNGTPTRRGRSQPAATKTQKPKNPTLPSFYRKTR